MIKTTSILIAAVTALSLSVGAYAQSNNTLATPSTTSPAAVTGGYGTPGVANSESGTGAGAPNRGLPNSTGNSSTPFVNAPGSHNTLATPSVVSPVGQ